MIITLSPAKILNFDSDVTITTSSEPIYKEEAKELNDLLKSKSIDELGRLMNISSDLLQNTFEYIHTFDLPQVQERQAGLAYNGIAYQGLDIASLNEGDLIFAQNHLVLLSGLYGILKPLDLIRPYRLDMQTKLFNRRGATLYSFWKDILTQHISDMMQSSSGVWVNLASKEYDRVIDRKKLPKGYKVITPIFKEARGDQYKQVIVYAKKARGMMARFIIQNRIENSEYIKAFDTEGYAYSEQLSTDKEWVFIR